MAVISQRLSQTARDMSCGLTDKEVMARTGLSFPTWRRILIGDCGVSDQQLLKLGRLGVDPKPLIEARNEALGQEVPVDDLVSFALGITPLTPSERYELIQHYRELMSRHQEEESDQEAA